MRRALRARRAPIFFVFFVEFSGWIFFSVQYCRELLAKISSTIMRQRGPPQNSKILHAKVAAKPPSAGALFSSVGGVDYVFS